MQLSTLRVKLYHENCWTSELTEMFPQGNLVIPVSRSIVEDGTITYTLVKASKSQIRNSVHMEKFSKFHPRILGALSGANHIQIFLVSFLFKSSNSIYRKMKEIEGAIPIQVTYENEYEIWNFLIPSNGSRDYKDLIFSGLESVAEIKGHTLEGGYQLLKENMDYYLELILSPSTLVMLQNLMEIGYFDFPRKISIDQAASQLGVSKGFISKVSRKIFDVLRHDHLDNDKDR